MMLCQCLISVSFSLVGSNSPSLQHLSREGGSGPAALPPAARPRGQQAAGSRIGFGFGLGLGLGISRRSVLVKKILCGDVTVREPADFPGKWTRTSKKTAVRSDV